MIAKRPSGVQDTSPEHAAQTWFKRTLRDEEQLQVLREDLAPLVGLRMRVKMKGTPVMLYTAKLNHDYTQSFFSVWPKPLTFQDTGTQMNMLSRIHLSERTLPSVGICEVRFMIHL